MDGQTSVPRPGGLTATGFRGEDVPHEEQFGHWSQLMDCAHAPLRLTSEHSTGFHARQRLIPLGEVFAWVSGYRRLAVQRTPALIRRSDPESFHVSLLLEGSGRVSWGQRRSALSAWDYLANDSSRPWEIAIGDRTCRTVSLEIPKDLLPLPRARAERAVGLPLDSGSGLGAVLGALLAQLAGDTIPYRASDAARLGSVATSLVAGMFASAVDAEHGLAPETRTHNLTLRVRAFIHQNLGDPGLSATTIAAAHHISVGHLHRLFREEGVTVGALIRSLRLQHAHADLANPALRTTPIHTIAATWGYPRPADFSRAFRTAYGLTPREHRNLGPLPGPTARTSPHGDGARP
ncbi:AraC-like ligand-binding domain-containing protein [Streptomyces sp. JNUCC 64]